MITALLAIMLAGIVHLPGRLMPGLEGGIESQNDTVQIGEANTTGVVTFTLAADFSAAPTVTLGQEISAQSAGSATGAVLRAEITARTADSVEVTVTLDAAPGAGETTDVRVHMIAAGALNR